MANPLLGQFGLFDFSAGRLLNTGSLAFPRGLIDRSEALDRGPDSPLARSVHMLGRYFVY